MGKVNRLLIEAAQHVAGIENELENLQAENEILNHRLDILNNALLFSMQKLNMSLEEILNAYNLAKNNIEPFADSEVLPSYEDMQEYRTADASGLTEGQKSAYYYQSLKMSGL